MGSAINCYLKLLPFGHVMRDIEDYVVRTVTARSAPSREATVPQRNSRQRSSTRAVVVFKANDKSSSSFLSNFN